MSNKTNRKTFRELLYSTDIEVSYFAAGIAAHLSSNSPNTWTVKSITKENLIQDLVKYWVLSLIFSHTQ
jgi:hypothetical protein